MADVVYEKQPVLAAEKNTQDVSIREYGRPIEVGDACRMMASRSPVFARWFKIASRLNWRVRF